MPRLNTNSPTRLPRKVPNRRRRRGLVGSCSVPALPSHHGSRGVGRPLPCRRPPRREELVAVVGDTSALLDGDGTSVPASAAVSLPPLGRVKHSPEELKFYHDTIKSGVVPDPVQLPVTRWPPGDLPPPPASSSVASLCASTTMQSSALGSTARAEHHAWLYSEENPAVVPIRGRETLAGQGNFNDAGRSIADTDATSDVGQVLCVTVTGRKQFPGQRSGDNSDSGGGPETTSAAQHFRSSQEYVSAQVFMPPERSTVSERVRQGLAEERALLLQVRAQGQRVRNHLARLTNKQGRPTTHGIMKLGALKRELTHLFCEGPCPTMRKRDIDRLMFSLPADKLSGTGGVGADEVNLNRLLNLDVGAPGGALTTARSARNKVVINVADMARTRARRVGTLPSEGEREDFLRDLVSTANVSMHTDRSAGDHDSQYGGRIGDDALRSSRLRFHGGEDTTPGLDHDVFQDFAEQQRQDKLARQKHLEQVMSRHVAREAQLSARRARQETKAQMKDSARLARTREVEARYQSFLEKETLRRMKQGNKFALRKFLENPPLRLDMRRHQYKQTITDGTRDQQIREYNARRAGLSKTEWHRIFR